MQLKEKMLELLGRPDYTPLGAKELFDKIQAETQNEQKAEFDRDLRELVDRGQIVAIKDGRYCLPSDADLIVGRIHFRQSGSATVFPENASENISIPSEETGVAMHGDQVVVRLISPSGARRYRMGPRGKAVLENKERTGKVIRILRRAHTRLTGTLAKEKRFFNVIPDDPRIVRNILVADPASSTVVPQPKTGDKVVVELEEWKQKHLNPEGRITAVLGRSHEPKTEHTAILVQYGLEKEFPPEVEEEAHIMSAPVSDSQREGRLDLRKQPVFTIDPDDAKDFDDALHLERFPDGRIQVGIHIADASAYVRPGSALDREAERRGNSTYLVGEVVPMLPHSLSSGICSLKEDEDRLTKSVIVTFSPHGEIEKTEFANTVIRSIKRLSYRQAKLIMDEDDFQKIREAPQPPDYMTGFAGKPLKALGNSELHLLQSHIRQMWSLARRLRSARMKAGSLDLDMPEAKIYLNAEGYPDRIVRVEHDESHQLIEEFMLLANEAVAKAFSRAKLSCIYRVHDKPDQAKLDELRESLLLMGVRVGDLSNQKEVARFIELTHSHPKGVYLRGLFLRSLKQACYRASPDGHYGLALADYAHFTSPIRRYADTTVPCRQLRKHSLLSITRVSWSG
jgi:ribonuclease R